MDSYRDTSLLELGPRLARVRDAAGLKQVDLARRITWSPAVLSRVESGERPVSPDELQTLLDAIGTPDAMQLAKALAREWRMLPRPPLDHPDQDELWEAEQGCRELDALRNDPGVRRAFERRLTEYIDDLRHLAGQLLQREHQVTFIGPKGIGKSTAICRTIGLEASTDGVAAVPVLETGGGGVTVCDVHIRSGVSYGLMIEPVSEDELRAHVSEFADHVMKRAVIVEPDEESAQDDEARGISQEIERAVRNLAGLKVKREKGADGKMLRHDEASDLARKSISPREFVVDVLARMELHRRDRRDIWHDPATGKPPLHWLRDTFEQVNNGRHPEFTLPNRIEIVVPQPLLGGDEFSVRFIDTRGVDRTVARADLERHLGEPHTVAFLCSSFNDAPSSGAQLLLQRARDAGIRNVERNAAVLVLPRAGEALAVKDESGARAETSEDGYALKAESAAMALEPLGLQNLTIAFFDAFSDDPARFRELIVGRLRAIRQGFRDGIQEALSSCRSAIANHEREQAQEVLRAAGQMIRTWLEGNRKVPSLRGHVHDALMAQLKETYAATIRATVRREGEWRNLSYGHHLGHGARSLAFAALTQLVNKFGTAMDLLATNPEYAEAKDLIAQARRVLDSAFEDLLRKAQLMGQTLFKDALKSDPSLWLKCEQEWGKGPGYRNRVMERNRNWFTAKEQLELEDELWTVVAREWKVVLDRLSAMLDPDAAVAERSQVTVVQ